MTPPCIDPAALRATMRRLASGVTVVTFRAGGEAAGMTANSFLSVSLEPALVLVSVRNGSRFDRSVGLGQYYGVSILGAGQRELSAHFGGRHDARLDVQFDEVDGLPLIAGSLAQLTARVVDIHPAGDHRLFIAEVEHLRCGQDVPPLLFQGGGYQRMHPAATHVHWQPGDGW